MPPAATDRARPPAWARTRAGHSFAILSLDPAILDALASASGETHSGFIARKTLRKG